MLVCLVDQSIERLNAKLEVHEQNAEAQDEQTVARLSFDPSPEGEALRKYLLKCTNALFRGMATYRKYKAKTGRESVGDVGVGRPQPDRNGRTTRDVRPTRGMVGTSGRVTRSSRETATMIVSSAGT